MELEKAFMPMIIVAFVVGLGFGIFIGAAYRKQNAVEPQK